MGRNLIYLLTMEPIIPDLKKKLSTSCLKPPILVLSATCEV